jgi:hypothetical protein
MKDEAVRREQLRNKFDELPVHGEAAGDWKKLKKTLQLTMPVNLLPFSLHGKRWLSKKNLWLYLLTLSLGGGVTALVLYNNRQASQQAATPKIYKDTVISQKAADTVKTTSKRTVPLAGSPLDTAFARKRKTSLPTAKDTTIRPARKHKTLPPVAKDTTVRRHKTAPAARS